MSTRELFTVPIYIVDNQVTQEQSAAYEKVCKKLVSEFNVEKFRNPGITYVTHRIKELNVHTIDEFQDATNLASYHTKNFLLDLGYSFDIKIANSWFNISYEGDYIQHHVHENTFLTCIIYVKNTSKSKIRFTQNLYSMLPRPQQDTKWNTPYRDIECNQGRLIVFRSDQVHGTNRQPRGEKISFVFNYKIAKNL